MASVFWCVCVWGGCYNNKWGEILKSDMHWRAWHVMVCMAESNPESFPLCACSSASVLMFYRNDSTVAPYPVQLPGCALDCPLEDFVRITSLSISDDRNRECQLSSGNRGNTFNRQLTHNMTKVSQNADFKFYVFISRSGHRSNIVWLPAPPPHHYPIWHYLLSERAGKQPEIPAGDQWRSWRWLLTQAQTPPSKICKSHIWGKQWWYRALNHFDESFYINWF